MALETKKNRNIYETASGAITSSRLYIDAGREASASASYASGMHILDDAKFEQTKELQYQFKLIQEDIDEVRRFTTGSGEISVDGGSF